MAVIRDIEPWDELLQAGRTDERLVTQSSVHPRPGRQAPIPEELHPKVTQALEAKGIDSLWSHQAEAIHAAWAGPTIVTTGTASGKSLCFQLPTLDVLCRDARARALYLYPT
jgi:DEAD/DEAH box helicase domain-containing protein